MTPFKRWLSFGAGFLLLPGFLLLTYAFPLFVAICLVSALIVVPSVLIGLGIMEMVEKWGEPEKK